MKKYNRKHECIPVKSHLAQIWSKGEEI